jgi:protein-tyrosine phosphatase
MVRVLFVCLGNICRSPMAEAVFARMVEDAGLSQAIEIDSAGTGDWHVGQRPHRGTRRILERYGIKEGSRARQICVEDLDGFDYIVAMDVSNRRNVEALTAANWPHKSELTLLLDYVPGWEGREVPDPYFTNGFDEVYEMVRRSCEALVQHIRSAHGL